VETSPSVSIYRYYSNTKWGTSSGERSTRRLFNYCVCTGTDVFAGCKWHGPKTSVNMYLWLQMQHSVPSDFRRHILDAFAKLRKATLSVRHFCPFLRPSVRRMEQIGSQRRDFNEILYLRVFRKSVEKV